jgi:5-methylcytosine-specific restriction endonuclease McrA
MKVSLMKTWAPKCAHPECNQLVGYHEKYLKQDGTPGAKWKTFCEYHRTVGKGERNTFIKSKGGCENRDSRLGWRCGDPGTPSLTVDHWDGNRHNNNQNNLVVLCANCHNEKSKRFKDTTQRYTNYNTKFHDFFEFVK